MTKLFMKSSTNYYYILSIVYSNQHKSIILSHTSMLKSTWMIIHRRKILLYQALVVQRTFRQEDPAIFQLLNVENSILVEQGIEFCCLKTRSPSSFQSTKFSFFNKHNNNYKIKKSKKRNLGCEISTIYRNNQWSRLI